MSLETAQHQQTTQPQQPVFTFINPMNSLENGKPKSIPYVIDGRLTQGGFAGSVLPVKVATSAEPQRMTKMSIKTRVASLKLYWPRHLERFRLLLMSSSPFGHACTATQLFVRAFVGSPEGIEAWVAR